MDEVEVQESQLEDSEAGQSPGEILARAREAKELSRVQVSEELGLTAAVIRDIELSRFEKFPSGIYVRGYIRNYCKLVGLEEEKILAVYDRFAENNPVPDESPFGSNEQVDHVSNGKIKLVIGVAALVVAIVLIVLFAL